MLEAGDITLSRLTWKPFWRGLRCMVSGVDVKMLAAFSLGSGMTYVS